MKLGDVVGLHNYAAPGDYKKNGRLYCCNCHTPKETYIDIPGKNHTGHTMLVPCMCKCESERREREQAEIANQGQRAKQSYRDGRKTSATFADDDGKSGKAMRACRKYAERFAEMGSTGLLLYGDVGTGKTFAAECIAHHLRAMGKSVWVGGFHEIEAEEINPAEHDLLVLDDLGTERETSYMRELVYAIVDGRYRSGKPIVASTNLTLDEMAHCGTIADKRIYSRLLEMCVPIRFQGADRRMANMAKANERARKILGM